MVVSASSQLLSDWQFEDNGSPLSVRLQPRLVVTANQAAINVTALGWGLTRVLSYQVAAKVPSDELEIVLQDFEQPPLPVHVVYQGGRKVAAKVRAFVDFCEQRLGQDPALNPHRPS